VGYVIMRFTSPCEANTLIFFTLALIVALKRTLGETISLLPQR